jgi:hypothetical protein
MQSFDTKDSNKLESSDTSSTKDSEVKQRDNEVVESFDRKFEGFDTKDPNVSIPNFSNFHANPSNSNKQSYSRAPLSDHPSLGSQGSEKSKTDGRCKPRTQKQIETYKCNFTSRKSIELKVEEFDSRLRHLQWLVLSLLSR